MTSRSSVKRKARRPKAPPRWPDRAGRARAATTSTPGSWSTGARRATRDRRAAGSDTRRLPLRFSPPRRDLDDQVGSGAGQVGEETGRVAERCRKSHPGDRRIEQDAASAAASGGLRAGSAFIVCTSSRSAKGLPLRGGSDAEKCRRTDFVGQALVEDFGGREQDVRRLAAASAAASGRAGLR